MVEVVPSWVVRNAANAPAATANATASAITKAWILVIPRIVAPGGRGLIQGTSKIR